MSFEKQGALKEKTWLRNLPLNLLGQCKTLMISSLQLYDSSNCRNHMISSLHLYASARHIIKRFGNQEGLPWRDELEGYVWVRAEDHRRGGVDGGGDAEGTGDEGLHRWWDRRRGGRVADLDLNGSGPRVISSCRAIPRRSASACVLD